MGSKKRTENEKDIDTLISLGVDTEFARMLPESARRQILNGILGLQQDGPIKKRIN